MMLLNVSEETARWNSMALANVDTAIPARRLQNGNQLTVHLAVNSQTLCQQQLDQLLRKEEYWSRNPARITCPYCRQALDLMGRGTYQPSTTGAQVCKF